MPVTLLGRVPANSPLCPWERRGGRATRQKQESAAQDDAAQAAQSQGRGGRATRRGRHLNGRRPCHALYSSRCQGAVSGLLPLPWPLQWGAVVQPDCHLRCWHRGQRLIGWSEAASFQTGTGTGSCGSLTRAVPADGELDDPVAPRAVDSSGSSSSPSSSSSSLSSYSSAEGDCVRVWSLAPPASSSEEAGRPYGLGALSSPSSEEAWEALGSWRLVRTTI